VKSLDMPEAFYYTQLSNGIEAEDWKVTCESKKELSPSIRRRLFFSVPYEGGV
jgi:hypothetical protein